MEQITVLIATGLHRPNEDKELEELIGDPWVLQNTKVENHSVSNVQGETVKSPMVGTVYLSPEPNAEKFVKKGDKVTKGQTLLIVEAMKVMNNISSPKDGVIEEIYIENAQPVEYDQPLVVIK